MSDSADTVVTIFRDELGIEIPGHHLDLIEGGLLDSLGLVTLVYEIEQRCGVSIPFETLDVDDFRSVGSIVALVETRQAATARA